MGIFLILVGTFIIFFSLEIGLIFCSLGFIIIIIYRQKNFLQKIKIERAKNRYEEIRFLYPTSDETINLSKFIDPSPSINNHRVWLTDAINALEKEYRISKEKMFLHNRTRTAAKFPYIHISKENMNHKLNQNYEKIFYYNGNYRKICNFLKRNTLNNLEDRLEQFIILIKKQEPK